jgi:hypothetical protein
VQLRLLAAALILVSSPAGAERAGEVAPALDASVRFYADDDSVTVVTPSASARVPRGSALRVELDTTIDAITAASVDLVSQASMVPYHERRIEASAAALYSPADFVTALVGISGSTESDYAALTPAVGARIELAQHNTILDLRYQLGLDLVGKVTDPDFAREKRRHGLVLGLTQDLDSQTVVDAVAEARLASGYLANPYRFVPIVDAGGSRLYSLPEAAPDRRAALALVARVRRALGSGRCFVHADYRFYLDDWGVRSHTVSLQGLLPVHPITLSAQVRGAAQGAADHYRAHYLESENGAPAWRTRDRALGGLFSLAANLTTDLALGSAAMADAPRVSVSGGFMRFVWRDFPLQNARNALVATLAISLPL